MNDKILALEKYIQPGKRVHLVGIGGVSMASLAEVLQGAGVLISGSDWHESPTVLRLRSHGIVVHTGPQRAENIVGAECVIRNAAARDDNPEIVAARAAGIPVFELECLPNEAAARLSYETMRRKAEEIGL